MGEREAITDFTSLIKLNQSNNQLNRLSICTHSFERYPDPKKIERGICDRWSESVEDGRMERAARENTRQREGAIRFYFLINWYNEFLI